MNGNVVYDNMTSIAIFPRNDSLLAMGTFNGMLRLYNIANLMSRLERMNHYYITPYHADLRRIYGEIHGIAQTTMLSKLETHADAEAVIKQNETVINYHESVIVEHYERNVNPTHATIDPTSKYKKKFFYKIFSYERLLLLIIIIDIVSKHQHIVCSWYEISAGIHIHYLCKFLCQVIHRQRFI
jgi:hypothetical protein